MEPKRAALLVIGNEILSGKVQEANLYELAQSMRRLGVALKRVVTVADEIDTIAVEIGSLSRSHDWLFTSGGVGPTHDDVTVEAAARAFGVSVVSSPELETMIRGYYGAACSEGHLRMALVPEGCVLETTDEVRWPTIRFENTWLMPGIPEVFKMKIPVIEARIGRDAAFVTRAVYTNMDEGDLKPLLDRIVSEHGDVEVGSYPKWRDSSYRTKLTFDGRDPEKVRAACDAFVSILPNGEPLRVE